MERSDGKIRKKGWEIAVKHDKIRRKWTKRYLGTDEEEDRTLCALSQETVI